MSGRILLTFEQFEKYQDDGMKHELVQGEHVVTPPATIGQSRIRQNIHDALWPYVRDHQLGEVSVAAGFKLPVDTFLKPDASFIRKSQIDRTDPDGYFEGAPALAIEVASESNTAAQLDLKIELYFVHGAEEVWIVYPKTRRVRAYFPDGHSETLASDLRSALFLVGPRRSPPSLPTRGPQSKT
jgi:Uma2 family endonuclease